jgi:hypothetical protein
MAWLIVFTEPSVVPVEMIMCICVLLTSVIVRLAPLHTIADGGSRTIDTAIQLNLSGLFLFNFLIRVFSSTRAYHAYHGDFIACARAYRR